MTSQIIETQLKCIKLVGDNRLSDVVTRDCVSEVRLLECLEALPEDNKLSSLSRKMQVVAMSSLEAANFITKLSSLVKVVELIDDLFEMQSYEELSKYEPEDLADALNDVSISKEWILTYIKFFKKEELSVHEKSLLCNSLFQMKEKGFVWKDDWLEANASILLEPVIANGTIKATTSYEQTIREFASNKKFADVFRFIEDYRSMGAHIDEENAQEILKSYEAIGELLPEVIDYFTGDTKRRFIYFWLDNHALLYDLEYFQKRHEKDASENFDDVVVSKSSYSAFLYGEYFSVALDVKKEPLVIYAVTKGKHAFLRLIRDNIQCIQDMPAESLLFNRDFYSNCVNLNTANAKDLAVLADICKYNKYNLRALANKERTFAEVFLLYDLPLHYIMFYDRLPLEKIDQKLIIMRELKKGNCLPNLSDYKGLEEKLAIKPLSKWMQSEFLGICNIKMETAVKLLIEYEELKHLIPNMNTEEKASFIITNKETLDISSIEAVKSSVLTSVNAWTGLCKTFKLSEDFVQQNRDRVLDFIFAGGAEVVLCYYQGMEDKYNEIRLLLIAELTGKFKQLKFHKGDLQKEINYAVSEQVEVEWEVNRFMEKGDISISEEYEFLPTMRIGVQPKITCLDYCTGNYKHCLLSCFDSNKKVIYLSVAGKVVLRALIRLTKGSWDKCDVSGPEIHFTDVTEELEDKGFVERKEQLVLFLERAYICNLSKKYEAEAFDLLFKFVAWKAKQMNALFALSFDYKDCVGSEWVRQSFYMYISKSKAGAQYLDSLGGECITSKEESYRQVYLLFNSKE